jgi:hypothetical protein
MAFYTALDPARQQIRLLHLLPGQRDEPVVCHLSIASLLDHVIYEVGSRGSMPLVSLTLAQLDADLEIRLCLMFGDPRTTGFQSKSMAMINL